MPAAVVPAARTMISRPAGASGSAVIAGPVSVITPMPVMASVPVIPTVPVISSVIIIVIEAEPRQRKSVIAEPVPRI